MAKQKSTVKQEATAKQDAASPNEKRVKIKLPRVEGEPEVVDVTVNGKMYRIRRGEAVEVPVVVKEILEQAGRL